MDDVEDKSLKDSEILPVRKQSSLLKRISYRISIALIVYFIIAYLFVPLLWKGYSDRHPELDSSPRITNTRDGHPGDPLNVSLIGSRSEVEAIMAAAKWFPADALGFRSDIKIAADTVLKRTYDEAPVSSLYLFGRKEDLAFEQPVGKDPSKRHHVRFWKYDKTDEQGRTIWLGSATYDERVGLSHTTGQITHHIAGDIDVERQHVMQDLESTGMLQSSKMIPGFHAKLTGKNGGGDTWQTDGSLFVGEIRKE